MNIRALALDQAPNNNGWAVGTFDMKAPIAGLFRLPPWGDSEGERQAAFVAWLTKGIVEHQITEVFYEKLYPIFYNKKRDDQQRNRNYEVRESQSKIIGHIEAVTYTLLQKELQPVVIADWRQRFIGTSKAAPGLKGEHARRWFKQRAVAQCQRRGWDITQEDAAEACGILDYGLASLSVNYASSTDPIFRRLEHQADHKIGAYSE